MSWATLQPLSQNVSSAVQIKQLDAVIGRNDLNTDRKAVSKAHLRISANGSGVTITDTSVNGTFINGARAKRDVPKPLHHGDIITLLAAESAEFAFIFLVSRKKRSAA